MQMHPTWYLTQLLGQTQICTNLNKHFYLIQLNLGKLINTKALL